MTLGRTHSTVLYNDNMWEATSSYPVTVCGTIKFEILKIL